MASTSSDRLNHIPQEFKDLFLWNPPKLQLKLIPGHKISSRTREPAFFDKHFSDKLKLLYVKRLPSLIRDIAALVDKTISDSPDNVFSLPPPRMLFSASAMELVIQQDNWEATDEKSVASFYNTTALFCKPVASTLALRIPYLLRWTQSNNASGYAIADGFLTFQSYVATRGVPLEKVMDEETVKLFQRLCERQVSLITYEFKNMVAGGPDTMLAVPKLSNKPKFSWTNCDSLDCATSAKHMKECLRVNAVDVGRDAKDTPWSFVSDDSENHFLEGMGGRKIVKRKRGDGSSGQSEGSPPSPSEASTVPAIPPRPTRQTRRGRQFASSSKSQPPTRTVRQNMKKQKLEDLANTSQSTVIMPPPPLPFRSQAEASLLTETGKGKAVVKGTKKARYDGEGSDGEPDDENRDEPDNESIDPFYKDKYDISAQFIVQQAWAQATRADCSIFVLNSGNHEFICIRHRGTQTLYISELIKPHDCKDPSYGKLHVGLYLAAVRDTMDRERQLMGVGNGPSGSGGNNADSVRGGGRDGGHEGDRRDPYRGRELEGGTRNKQLKQSDTGNGSKVASTGMAAHKLAAKMTSNIAGCRNIILLFLKYGIYDSSNPSVFMRSLPSGLAPNPLPSRETVRSYKLKECLTVVLKSEIGHGATGVVLRGTLEVEASEGCILLDVAVKLALSSEQREALRNEYATYCHLRLKAVTSGIIAPLGLFYDVDPEGGPSALVMPYAGEPLDEMPELILPHSHREAILASLEKIHRADVLHGDLCLRNILMVNSGLTIIDFSHSRVCKDQDAKNREYLQLQSLLDRRAK